MGGGASAQLLNRNQVILNKAARWCTGMGKRSRVTELMTATGWLNVAEQIKLSTLIFTWKVVHLSIPRRMNDRLNISEDMKINIEDPRLKFSRKCYRWRSERSFEEWIIVSLAMTKPLFPLIFSCLTLRNSLKDFSLLSRPTRNHC